MMHVVCTLLIFCAFFPHRAESGGREWGVRSVVLAFSRLPDFQPRGPKLLVLKGLGTFGLKIGAPQKRQIQRRRIQPPILGPLNPFFSREFRGSVGMRDPFFWGLVFLALYKKKPRKGRKGCVPSVTPRTPTPKVGHRRSSEAWGPPQFQEKRSRSEKAFSELLDSSGVFLGAALGIRNSILGIRNSILGMAFQDLSNTKTKVLGATPERFPELIGTHMKDFHLPIGRTPRGSCNHTRLLEGFLEGSLKEVLLRRVLRRRLVRVSIETEVLRRGGVIEGA